MTTVVGISGSLRRASYNSSLLRAATGLMPVGSVLQIASIEGIPLYNGDDEAASGIPTTVSGLKDILIVADALLLIAPEYNNSVPGVAKNAIDWLSRPPGDIKKVFGGKPIAITGASPGNFGTLLGQSAWLPIFKTLGANVWAGGRLVVPKAATVFDVEGGLTDAATRVSLQKFLAGFVAFVETMKK